MKKSELGLRLSVAAIGVPLLLFITWLGGPYLAVSIGFIAIVMMWEYFRLVKVYGFEPLRIPAVILGMGIIFLWSIGGKFLGISLAMSFVLIASLGIILHRSHRDVIATVGGILYIPLLMGTFIMVRNNSFITNEEGRWLAWCIWGAIWIGDTAAYGFGKNFGKHKLAVKISPKKTIEGFVAGIFGALIFTVIWWLIGKVSLEHAIVVGIIAGTFGQLGDLIESQFKREVGVKDVGNYLPGHGGFLDRFDSLLTTAPVVLFYLYLKDLFV